MAFCLEMSAPGAIRQIHRSPCYAAAGYREVLQDAILRMALDSAVAKSSNFQVQLHRPEASSSSCSLWENMTRSASKKQSNTIPTRSYKGKLRFF